MLKSYREKKKSDKTRKEHGETIPVSEYSDVRVAEDYPERVTKMRTALYPFMIQSLEAEKNAYLKYDKLVVDNVTHEYNEELKQPMAVDKPKQASGQVLRNGLNRAYCRVSARLKCHF